MHPYPRHLDGCDYLGFRRYFLTFCTHDRHPLFATAGHVALVESHFLRTAKEMEFADLVHCFMPDHLHAVVEGRAACADARLFISRMKQYSGFYFRREFKLRLWQRYGYEHVIRDDEATKKVLQYVLENPIRAGLVSNILEYPFIGSSAYTREQLLEFCSNFPGSGASA